MTGWRPPEAWTPQPRSPGGGFEASAAPPARVNMPYLRAPPARAVGSRPPRRLARRALTAPHNTGSPAAPRGALRGGRPHGTHEQFPEDPNGRRRADGPHEPEQEARVERARRCREGPIVRRPARAHAREPEPGRGAPVHAGDDPPLGAPRAQGVARRARDRSG